MVFFLNYLIYVLYAIAGYLISIFIKYILDHKWSYFRFDNWLLFLLLVKPPYASSKVVLNSEVRPNIDEIKEIIVHEFDLSNNEKTVNNSYTFTLVDHPTAMKIKIIEPDRDGDKFTLTLETISKDTIPKLIHNSSFKTTIETFERITRLLEKYKLSVINVEIDITLRISDKNNNEAIYSYKGNTISYNTMGLSSKNFTSITKLANECIKFWRDHFL